MRYLYLKNKKMRKIALGKYSPTLGEYNVVDQFGMHGYIDNRYHGDSLGGGYGMYYCYNDPCFVEAAKDMWYFDENDNYTGQRHPRIFPEDHPMSRDHYITTLLTLILHYKRTGDEGSLAKVREITEETGYIISSMARRTLSIKLWSKALLGDKKAEKRFYWLQILTVALVYLPVHKLLSLVARYGSEVDQEEYKLHPILQELPKYKTWISKTIYPSYALLLIGWQLYMLDDCSNKRVLSWLYRQMVGKTNYVQKMLFGKKGIARERVITYKPMKGGRWSGYLSCRNDRNMAVLKPKPQYNNVDNDLARRLYNETQIK